MDHSQIFDQIYTNNLWKGSGVGSTEKNTRQYRWFLQSFLRSNHIKSVLDIGCGDWQFSRHIDWTGIDYLGVDVSAVVLANTKTFARSGIAFRELNAVTDQLPAADVLIAKDVLQHWGNSDILAFLPKLTSVRMALITNGFDPARMSKVNLDIKPGSWRPVDLQRAPFNLAGSYVYWFNGGEPKFVFLWSNPANTHSLVEEAKDNGTGIRNDAALEVSYSVSQTGTGISRWISDVYDKVARAVGR